MWCYQKPGFEALLLAELQRQQQCSQFCDTLLKTEGVSVPAHSCVLSALSPHFSSTLSSTPQPPAGQSRLLEFRALGACTLLHMVRLLYCGEMAGEGEKEKQEAISAAAKLGIHGLVEVTKRQLERGSVKGDGGHTEAGVQTEPLMPEEDEGRGGRWRREVRDGSTFLWKDTLPDGRKDSWTQTEELQEQLVPAYQPAAPLETINIADFQSLGQTASHFVPPQIPYIPISLVYPPNENPTQQPSYALMDSMQESTSAAGFTSILVPQHTFVPQTLLPFSSQGPPCAAGLQSWWSAPQEAAGEAAAANEWEDQNLVQFDGNITGYIQHFLNPDKEEGVGSGRARRRRGAGEGGARRGGAGERRARRPRAGTGGRGRGGLTQTVDVQEVGVSRLQKLFLQRVWGGTPRTGQGGGAAGRKLFLKPRELLKSTKKRGPGKVWGVGDVLPYIGERGGKTQRGRKSTTQQVNPDGLPVGRPRRRRPPRLPPHEEQPEPIERLLEEVMNDLDILKNNGAPQPQPPPPTSSSDVASCGNTVTQNKSGSNGSPRVVVVARGGGSPSVANPGTPVQLGQGEGEVNETLYTLLQSFEHYMDSCSACEEAEMGAQSRTEASQLHTVPRRNRRRRKTQTPKSPNTAQRKNTPHPARQQSDEAETPLRRSLSSARSAAPPEHTEGSTAPDKKRERKRIKPYMLSLDRKRVRVRKPVSSSGTKTTPMLDQRDVKLLHTPVLKPERSGRLSDKVMERSCKEVKKSAKTTSSLSSVTQPRDSVQEAAPPISWSTKNYPIRSRLRKANIMDRATFLVEPLQTKRPSSAGPGRDSLSNESSSLPVEPQPMEPCVMGEQLERNPETREEELTVQPLEEVEEETRRGEKRHTEPEETGEESSVPKRVCFEQTAQPTSETCALSSKSADCVSEPAPRERRDIVSVETVPIAGECLPIDIRETDCEMESSGEEMIAVDGEPEDSDTSPQTLSHCVEAKLSLSPTSLSATEFSLTSTGSWEDDKDEDVDVIGGSSPAPDPVLFSWTECSEVEEEEGDEDIDVVGDNPIYTLSSLLATVR
ncbi:uncharacterized protein LOC117487667 [Trematomus bernacchii]|uniref:uncharacterized protein LOC117487667 n=1 Tax=Trematomus bernacchii TaxID=40690 RepID=UPI00146E9931|nr:uncharacterized protein LOC117487667 [Trematomus bernacchii]